MSQQVKVDVELRKILPLLCSSRSVPYLLELYVIGLLLLWFAGLVKLLDFLGR